MLTWNAQGAITYEGDASLQASAMNDSGQVAGTTYQCGETSCRSHAAVWTVDGMTMLPDRGEGGQALAINRHGTVAGVVFRGGVSYGALWSYQRP